MDSLVNSAIHQHPLYPSSRFVRISCRYCGVKGHIYDGYRCNDSKCDRVWFHKKCVETSPEINHPYHPQHPLFFVEFTPWHMCDLCGKHNYRSGYGCTICGFTIDTACASKPPPSLVITNPRSHEHPLYLLRKRSRSFCEVCQVRLEDTYPFTCVKCDVYFHVECANLSVEMNHPSHPNHPLKFITSDLLISCNVDKDCSLCGLEFNKVLYRCYICNYSVCLDCVINPPPMTMLHPKTHEHKLQLMPTVHVSFDCNVCGMQGDRSPYMCLECGFVVHRGCIDLPRVININRHDHRMSLTQQLGFEVSKCGVCRQKINRFYGAYKCSTCPNYFVHSQCATSYKVWDGVDLEGVPEDIGSIVPFKVVGQNMIRHFSHESHNLILDKNRIVLRDESIRCEACVLPIYSDPIFYCEQCDFTLHEKCANLPREKRLAFRNRRFTLEVGGTEVFSCGACGIISSGFRYVSGYVNVDVCCALILESSVHDGHIHPLHYNEKKNYKCGACHKVSKKDVEEKTVSCDDCEFSLDFHCAGLPKMVKHRYDRHPLQLCYSESVSNKYWCDICEGETNPNKWFYTCFDCGVTLHVDCVLGDFSRLMPGRGIVEYLRCKFEVVLNSHSSRPVCGQCHLRCRVPVILKFLRHPLDDMYICSRRCASIVIIKHKYNVQLQ